MMASCKGMVGISCRTELFSLCGNGHYAHTRSRVRIGLCRTVKPPWLLKVICINNRENKQYGNALEPYCGAGKLVKAKSWIHQGHHSKSLE